MQTYMRAMLMPLLLAAIAPIVVPQTTPMPTCAARDAALPADLAGWATTGTGVGFDRSFQLDAKGGAAEANFTISKPGRYRIALDQAGWIDLISAGATLKSATHGHGPECSTIRKLVAFDLVPGSYTLRITKLGGAKARAMIVSPKD